MISLDHGFPNSVAAGQSLRRGLARGLAFQHTQFIRSRMKAQRLFARLRRFLCCPMVVVARVASHFALIAFENFLLLTRRYPRLGAPMCPHKFISDLIDHTNQPNSGEFSITERIIFVRKFLLNVPILALRLRLPFSSLGSDGQSVFHILHE